MFLIDPLIWHPSFVTKSPSPEHLLGALNPSWLKRTGSAGNENTSNDKTLKRSDLRRCFTTQSWKSYLNLVETETTTKFKGYKNILPTL